MSGSKSKSSDLTQKQRDLFSAMDEIVNEEPSSFAFLHSPMCMVHLPRARTSKRVHARSDGGVSLRVEAGSLWDNDGWREQGLPYGSKPRLILVHAHSYAIRHRTREIPIGDTLGGFLKELGLATSGGPRGNYRAFRSQMNALAACRMLVGYSGPTNNNASQAITRAANVIDAFAGWLGENEASQTIWPGVIRLSAEYYDSVLEHSTPLDPRALNALSSSSLELDIYTWAAHRLHRVGPKGLHLTWHSLRGQFVGYEGNTRTFKRKFLHALRNVCAVYPDARIESVHGGLHLRRSHPPIRTRTIHRVK